MRFLIDEDVDARLLGGLRRLGHEAKRVPSGTQNGAVMRLAKAEKRVLITRDADFTDADKFPPTSSPGIIHVLRNPQDRARIISGFRMLVRRCRRER